MTRPGPYNIIKYMTAESFPPVYTEKSRILILGSSPGKISLDAGQYYANPHNAFWHIMFEILGEEYADDYAVRLDMIKSHELALWDMAAVCERDGSSDSTIRDVTPNDIKSLLRSMPLCGRILCNGAAAYKLAEKELPDTDIPVLRMPSTSPAYASMPYEKKLALWREAIIGGHK